MSKLTDADGEQQETLHWDDTALDCGYLTKPVRDELVEELEKIGRMLHSMIEKADLFCGSPTGRVSEASLQYFTATDH